MEDIKENVRNFIFKTLRNEWKDNDDILESGAITSLFSMQLILFLERNFDIHLDRNDLNNENFRSINSITLLVERKVKEEKWKKKVYLEKK